jgi:integrase
MPQQIETTHQIMHRSLVLYRRENSQIWQCRYKVAGIWQRATTKEYKLSRAEERAKELLIEAEIRNRSNLPVVTRRFKDIASLAIQRMEQEAEAGRGKVIYKDYIRVINDYLITSLGSRLITNIDYVALENFEAERIRKMGRNPTSSTMHTQNAALNRVFDEAVIRGFLTEANRPKLSAKGQRSERRPAFELSEVKVLLQSLEAWINKSRNAAGLERRLIMRDYIEMLLDTGARPGIELLNLKWKQIRFSMDPKTTVTDTKDQDSEIIELHNLNRSCEMTVSGKTGTRQIIGRLPSVKVLERVALRNYSIKGKLTDPLSKVIGLHPDEYVFRTKDKKENESNVFNHMFDRFLKDNNLLIDSKTDQKRVFYSLRHTYATLALTHDRVPIHTLAKQMGTSVVMIERHYSHLKVSQAIDHLRGEASRRLLS